MLSLELVKTRLAVMNMEMRKSFIQAVLTSLIEKSPDAKVLRAVVKIVEEWVKNSSPMAANQVSRRSCAASECERASGTWSLVPCLLNWPQQGIPSCACIQCAIRMESAQCARHTLSRRLRLASLSGLWLSCSDNVK
jgi:hypothetical protein